jgi:hypothetical protein
MAEVIRKLVVRQNSTYSIESNESLTASSTHSQRRRSLVASTGDFLQRFSLHRPQNNIAFGKLDADDEAAGVEDDLWCSRYLDVKQKSRIPDAEPTTESDSDSSVSFLTSSDEEEINLASSDEERPRSANRERPRTKRVPSSRRLSLHCAPRTVTVTKFVVIRKEPVLWVHSDRDATTHLELNIAATKRRVRVSQTRRRSSNFSRQESMVTDVTEDKDVDGNLLHRAS